MMTQSRPPRVWPTREFGRGEAIQARLGINPISGELLAAIIIFAANVEFHLEGAIWKLRGQEISPKPDTDTNITDRLRLFDAEVAKIADDNLRGMLETWSKATRAGFIIRNNIVHA